VSELTIELNKNKITVAKGVTIQGLLELQSLPEQGCAVALNNQVIPKSKWNTTTINSGDSLSIFQAIAGG
jgi:sulfur carrier protein